jgi:hypothetical protein
MVEKNIYRRRSVLETLKTAVNCVGYPFHCQSAFAFSEVRTIKFTGKPARKDIVRTVNQAARIRDRSMARGLLNRIHLRFLLRGFLVSTTQPITDSKKYS